MKQDLRPDLATTISAGAERLAVEPTADLVRRALAPADVVRALGWPGAETEISLPIPVDHRRVIDPSAAQRLVVISGEEPLPLRRTLCSVFERAAAPIAVTLARPALRSSALDDLLGALAIAVAGIELTDSDDSRLSSGVERLDAGEELPWGWPHAPAGGVLPTVAFVLPGMPAEGAGGVLSVVQEARGLRSLGAEASICIPASALERAERVYGNADGLFVPYTDSRDLEQLAGDAAVLVATEHTSVPLVARLARSRDDVACAYYVQDYEPLFAEPGSSRSDQALLSYRALSGATLFAKTYFIQNVVTARHRVAVAKVEPSLDRSLFHTGSRRPSERLTVAAMVRPRTPRRRSQATLAILSKIKLALGDQVTIVTFGCTASELRGHNLEHVTHRGRLRPSEVADQLRDTDIFVDASAYQAFGRAGLEAMACGAVPILPSLGGVNEYAVNDENAILVDDDSPDSIATAAIDLAGDRDRLARLREAGLQTVSRFSIERAAQSELELFSAISPAGGTAAR